MGEDDMTQTRGKEEKAAENELRPKRAMRGYALVWVDPGFANYSAAPVEVLPRVILCAVHRLLRFCHK